MNILYIINYAGTGGSEKYVETLAARRRPRDRVFFIYNQEGGLAARMEALGVKTTRVNMRGPFDIAAAKKIADYCRENNVHVVHTQFQRENYLSVLARMFYPHIRVVYTSHIILKNNLLWKLTNSIVCRGDAAVIAVCSEGARLLKANKMPADRIRLVYNGIPFKSREVTRTNRERFVFITLTRFSEEKGVFFLLEAVEALKTLADRPFHVMLVGGGPLLDAAVRFAKERGISDCVTFTGFREDAATLLESADAFVNSSSNESLSFAILEAMAAGLPIIATSVGGNPDIVNETTGCGVLTPYGDAPAMARVMSRMMSDSDAARAYGENALRAVKNIFNEEIMIERTYQIYEQVRRCANDY